MGIIYETLRPLIFRQDPEVAHNRIIALGQFAQKMGACGILKRIFEYSDPRLNIEIDGVSYKNPIGLAAGFDKNGKVCELVESLGFGFMEVGSVTYMRSDGNPRPRILRLPEDGALVNRMGLNNDGVYAVRENLKSSKHGFPIGVNLAKTHSTKITDSAGIGDFVKNYLEMQGIGSFKVLNISCPNTAEGKTFEDPGMFKELLSEIYLQGVVSRLYVKLSPDLADDNLDKLLQIAEDAGVTGYVVSNTSVKRENIYGKSILTAEKFGAGGLSGLPIKDRSTKMIKRVCVWTKKSIFGVGGVFTAADAYEKIKAGASGIEVYAGMIYRGPMIAREINKGLVKLLERDGLKSISSAVGVDV